MSVESNIVKLKEKQAAYLQAKRDEAKYILRPETEERLSDKIETSKESVYDAAYEHSKVPHAPADAQKNSDITKTEITEKLTGNVKFGDVTGGDYSEFEADGSLHMVGAATIFDDEKDSIIGLKFDSPASSIIINLAEGTLTFDNRCSVSDYVYTGVQLTHKWLNGSSIGPHIHWFQVSSATPNWVIQYRWQKQGGLKTTTWTSLGWNSNAFTYVSGTLNQITSFPAISPPTGYGQVSDIIQVRILRDISNSLGLFAGAETGPVDQDVLSFDVHIECDTLGSREQYVK